MSYHICIMHGIYKHACISGLCRVTVVLQDVASEEMYNLGKWHIFFPSEVCFGFYISLGHEVLHTTRALN